MTRDERAAYECELDRAFRAGEITHSDLLSRQHAANDRCGMVGCDGAVVILSNGIGLCEHCFSQSFEVSGKPTRYPAYSAYTQRPIL